LIMALFYRGPRDRMARLHSTTTTDVFHSVGASAARKPA
jgi:hypothetical protein